MLDIQNCAKSADVFRNDITMIVCIITDNTRRLDVIDLKELLKIEQFLTFKNLALKICTRYTTNDQNVSNLLYNYIYTSIYIYIYIYMCVWGGGVCV